jgi:hypothetical protein
VSSLPTVRIRSRFGGSSFLAAPIRFAPFPARATAVELLRNLLNDELKLRTRTTEARWANLQGNAKQATIE